MIITNFDKESLDKIVELLQDGLSDFYCTGVPKEEIFIYIPNYFAQILERHLSYMYRANNTLTLITFFGIKCVESYENKIVISCKDSILKNIEPIKINIT